MKVLVLNGWAASPQAWSLCGFKCDRIFSYLDHLNGVTAKAFEDEQEKVILVGWSMGGSFALRLALQNPSKVHALVLIATTARMMKDENWPGMTERRLAALEAGLRLTMGKGFGAFPEGAPNPYILDTDENLARGLDYLRATDLRSLLLENKTALAHIETYIFQALRDPIVRKENADFLSSVFSLSRLEMIDSAEHALPIYIPKKIDSVLRNLGAEVRT